MGELPPYLSCLFESYARVKSFIAFTLPTELEWEYATLAQLVEHLIRNEEVAGSIPAGGSSLLTCPIWW